MEAHVNQVTKQCFAKLRNIGKIRRFLSSESAKTVIHATVMSRIDYGNALLCGITDSLCRRLQKIQNYAARMITRTAYHDHVTPALQSLHWLPVRSRLDYKVLVIVYQAVYGLAPSYIQELFINLKGHFAHKVNLWCLDATLIDMVLIILMYVVLCFGTVFLLPFAILSLCHV